MKKNLSTPKAHQGFALIATISVLSLILLVALAMVNLSAVETKKSGHNNYQLIAQANARLALKIALGQLQQYAGPDQRVTAEAAILETPGSATMLENRHWVGIWGTDKLKGETTGALPIIYRSTSGTADEVGSLIDRRADGSYDKKAEALTWLVSQNPSATIDPTVALLAGDSVQLVGSNSATPTEDQVRAPIVKVWDDGKETGSYAYWVGDEGVKARYDLGKETSGLAVNHPSLVPAQGGMDILADFADYETSLIHKKVITRNTLDHSDGAKKDAKLTNFHDISFFSLGIPVDTQNGGLRKDLSAFLRDGAAADLGSHKGITSDSPILNSEKLKKISPQFGLLDSWNRAGTTMSASTGIDPIAPSNIYNGTQWGWSALIPRHIFAIDSGINLQKQDKAPIHPIMIDAGVSYGVSLERIGTTTEYHINLHYFPRIVLWNPYNVKLNAAKYAVRIHLPHRSEAKIIVPGSSTEKRFRTIHSYHNGYGGSNIPHRPAFSLASTSFEPGEALLFTADAGNSTGNKFWGERGSATSNDLSHFTLSCKKTPPLTDSFYFSTGHKMTIADADLPDAAFQFISKRDAAGDHAWKINSYKLYLDLGKSNNANNVKTDQESFAPLQNFNQSENGMAGSAGPWYIFPNTVSTPLVEVSDGPSTPFDRLKWGHRIQWIDETVENRTVEAGDPATPANKYNTPYMGYNTIANHNMRAGWHVRSGVEVALRATDVQGRYTHGISIDDPYGWRWSDQEPVQVNGKNRVSPFGKASDFDGQTFPLLDIPTLETPLVSLGALQHAPLSQFVWHPTYAVGNSLVDPRVPRNRSINYVDKATWDKIGPDYWKGWDQLKQAHVDADLNKASFLHDLSYEANYSLWDSYFLSDIKAGQTMNQPLTHPRLAIISDGIESELQNYHLASKHIGILGAFNVNSTSVKAWAALIASFRDGTTGTKITLDDGSILLENDVYSRFFKPYKDHEYKNETTLDPKMWKGYRKLSKDQITAIAEEMVKEVKLRGPFLSLADFVNRRLVDTPKQALVVETPYTATGLKGALQAAIDRADSKSINKTHLETHKIAKTEYEMKGPPGAGKQQVNYGTEYPNLTASIANGDPDFGVKPDHHHWADSKLVGTPSYLTQADLLQKLGPILAARSDTFTIRCYGEAKDNNNNVKAKVWCEAIVQRTADPVFADSEGIDPHADTTTNPAALLGRKFKIMSFRWLAENEI